MFRVHIERRWLVAAAAASTALVALPLATRHVAAGGSTLTATMLVSTPPTIPGTSTLAHGPDDLALLGGVLWTAYQNEINADGTPNGLGSYSTLAGFDPTTGALVETIPVLGKIDGLAADPANNRLLATVNEDLNSAFNVIDPATSTVTRYTYSPTPVDGGNGGTDSIAVWDGEIFTAHSNPNDTLQAATYEVKLDQSTLTAHLTPLFHDNSPAQDAASGANTKLALTDPDTNAVLPSAAPRFAGQLAQISQGDGQIIFASADESDHLSVLNLSDGTGNAPPADGIAVATANAGNLYLVDNGTGIIWKLQSTLPAGTVFVDDANDTGNPLLGTLDLSSGTITPFGNTFTNPHGMLFVD